MIYMGLNKFGQALEHLGIAFEKMGSPEGERELTGPEKSLADELGRVQSCNPWFTPEFTAYAVRAWAAALQKDKIERWLGMYRTLDDSSRQAKRVGVVMAGNLPMVGLHDLLCVLASGHSALVKLSSKDDRLIPAAVEVLASSWPEAHDRVVFAADKLKGFDAMLATGSNNTFRYFDYYFRNVPSVIRRNRNGVAILRGDEKEEWFRCLADDIFVHFGLGCRNVSKLFLPDGFDPAGILPFFGAYSHLAHHHKYANNYDYQKSLLLINRDIFFDNGFLLLKPAVPLASPVAVVHYEFYSSEEELKELINGQISEIQCIVDEKPLFPGRVRAGTTQLPELWDYADGVDTMEFLLGLDEKK